MQKFNIVTPGRKYITRDGQEKTEWLQLGKATYFPPADGKDAGLIIDWNSLPGVNVVNQDGKRIYKNPVACFLQKPKVETTGYEGEFNHEPIKDEDVIFG